MTPSKSTGTSASQLKTSTSRELNLRRHSFVEIVAREDQLLLEGVSGAAGLVSVDGGLDSVVDVYLGESLVEHSEDVDPRSEPSSRYSSSR